MNAGLANIAGLAYLISIPVLVFIYYHLRKIRRREVSSLILWRSLRKHLTRRRRFRADFLFYLQLLILLLLVLAAARPYWRAAGRKEKLNRHVILVMDRSASMQAKEGFRTRWETARQRALKTVRSLDDGDRVTLIGSGAEPAILAAGEEDRSRVEEIIRKMDASDTPDRLRAAVELAGNLPAGNEAGGDSTGDKNLRPAIHIFTDRSRESLGLEEPPAGWEVSFQRVGRPMSNAAITALEIHHSPFFPSREKSIYATVENFSQKAFTGALSLLAGNRSLLHRRIRLEPAAARTFRLECLRPVPAGKLIARLTPSDELAVDNTAYAVVKSGGVRPVILAPRGGRVIAQWEELAQAIPGVKLEVRRPNSPPPAEIPASRVGVYYRGEPDEEPEMNLLLICPPVESRFLRGKEAWLPSVSFIDWDENHPVGKNLGGLNNVPLNGCRLFEVSSWARPVVFAATPEGDAPVVFCGEYRGRRTAIVGFDLAAIDLKSSRARPVLILLLNLLGWLCDDGERLIRTGDSFNPAAEQGGRDDGAEDAGKERVVFDPRGEAHRGGAAQGEKPTFLWAEEAGFYTVKDASGETVLAANLFNREESDLLGDGPDEKISPFRAAAFPGELAPRGAAPNVPDRRSLFLSFFLALIIAEWTFFSLRYRGASAAGKEEKE